MLYTAGEAAKILGIPASTLRYYDKEGLLPELERSSGGMRMFRDSDFASLRLIQCLKKAGLPLRKSATSSVFPTMARRQSIPG